jgi:hypothetical protein
MDGDSLPPPAMSVEVVPLNYAGPQAAPRRRLWPWVVPILLIDVLSLGAGLFVLVFGIGQDGMGAVLALYVGMFVAPAQFIMSVVPSIIFVSLRFGQLRWWTALYLGASLLPVGLTVTGFVAAICLPHTSGC